MDDPTAPATKADITVVKSDITAMKADIIAVNGRLDVTNERIGMLRTEFHHAFDELRETMRDGQTELLKAFSDAAKAAEAKLEDGDIADFLLRNRLTPIESRQTDMERRLNTPPQP